MARGRSSATDHQWSKEEVISDDELKHAPGFRTVAILRGHRAVDAVELAKRCWDVGIELVEVTVQGESGWRSLDAVVAISDGRPVGSGTILTTRDLTRAAQMGASVAVSPHVSGEIRDEAERLGLSYLPGVMSPTEVAAASRMGISACKLFPAEIVGPRMITALHGPFPDVSFVAVGGIDIANARSFVDAGAAGVAFGSSLKEVLASSNPDQFVRDIHEWIQRGQQP